jgi:hypothetical protein
LQLLARIDKQKLKNPLHWIMLSKCKIDFHPFVNSATLHIFYFFFILFFLRPVFLFQFPGVNACRKCRRWIRCEHLFFALLVTGLFGKDMYRTEKSSGLLILELVKSDDVI